MKRIDVRKKDEPKLLKTVYNNLKIVNLKSKFHVGDDVRITENRGLFDKTYTPNWSTEIITIGKPQLTNPTTYILKDNKDILGGYYQEQLQNKIYPNVYRVEKILKRKGIK